MLKNQQKLVKKIGWEPPEAETVAIFSEDEITKYSDTLRKLAKLDYLIDPKKEIEVINKILKMETIPSEAEINHLGRDLSYHLPEPARTPEEEEARKKDYDKKLNAKLNFFKEMQQGEIRLYFKKPKDETAVKEIKKILLEFPELYKELDFENAAFIAFSDKEVKKYPELMNKLNKITSLNDINKEIKYTEEYLKMEKAPTEKEIAQYSNNVEYEPEQTVAGSEAQAITELKKIFIKKQNNFILNK